MARSLTGLTSSPPGCAALMHPETAPPRPDLPKAKGDRVVLNRKSRSTQKDAVAGNASPLTPSALPKLLEDPQIKMPGSFPDMQDAETTEYRSGYLDAISIPSPSLHHNLSQEALPLTDYNVVSRLARFQMSYGRVKSKPDFTRHRALSSETSLEDPPTLADKEPTFTAAALPAFREDELNAPDKYDPFAAGDISVDPPGHSPQPVVAKFDYFGPEEYPQCRADGVKGRKPGQDWAGGFNHEYASNHNFIFPKVPSPACEDGGSGLRKDIVQSWGNQAASLSHANKVPRVEWLLSQSNLDQPAYPQLSPRLRHLFTGSSLASSNQSLLDRSHCISRIPAGLDLHRLLEDLPETPAQGKTDSLSRQASTRASSMRCERMGKLEDWMRGEEFSIEKQHAMQSELDAMRYFPLLRDYNLIARCGQRDQPAMSDFHDDNTHASGDEGYFSANELDDDIDMVNDGASETDGGEWDWEMDMDVDTDNETPRALSKGPAHRKGE